MKTHISDTGMKDFTRQVKNLRGRVEVGVFGDEHGPEVVIAATHEFGTDRAGKNHNVTIPERSFLRATLDEQRNTTRKTIGREKANIVTGKTKKEHFLNRLGVWFVGQVQKKIREGGTPFIDNSPATKRAKHRTKPIPLNDEGRLRQSITHRVKT